MPCGGIEFRETAVERDAVLEVDDEVALDQLGEIEQLVDLARVGDGARVERQGRRWRWRPKISVSVTTTRPARARRPRFLGRSDPGAVAKGDAETLVEGAAQEAGLDGLQRGVFGEDSCGCAAPRPPSRRRR
jgi:hypothetical protein